MMRISTQRIPSLRQVASAAYSSSVDDSRSKTVARSVFQRSFLVENATEVLRTAEVLAICLLLRMLAAQLADDET